MRAAVIVFDERVAAITAFPAFNFCEVDGGEECGVGWAVGIGVVGAAADGTGGVGAGGAGGGVGGGGDMGGGYPGAAVG